MKDIFISENAREKEKLLEDIIDKILLVVVAKTLSLVDFSRRYK